MLLCADVRLDILCTAIQAGLSIYRRLMENDSPLSEMFDTGMRHIGEGLREKDDSIASCLVAECCYNIDRLVRSVWKLSTAAPRAFVEREKMVFLFMRIFCVRRHLQ